MADTNKKEYTSNLHPKGDMDTTVYPNVKSENIIDKDTTAYTAGKVPDSSMVSKSLDGLNEKIETNKIQTDTNKTNIATLQSDVSSLKQDNQTTKTTIAGLVSADTQNKKDIDNLKANYTEVQSQSNTNSSDIALLKTNTIKKDTDASLKSLTLPSAKDLKTKDGTSFGEGLSKPWFSSNEYIGILSKSVTTSPVDDYLSGLYNVDGTVGLIAQNNKSGVIASFIPSLNADFPIFMYQGNDVQSLVQLPDKFFTESTIITLGDGLPPYVYTYNASTDGKSGVIIKEHLIGVQVVTSDKKYNSIGLNVTENFVFATFNDAKNNNTLYILPDGLSSDFVNTVSVPAKTGTIALIEDLATKQDKRFVHTVEIHYASNGSYFCFTGTSDKNTPIDSVQDLTTVFANRDLCGVGVFGSAGLSKIHVGSSVNDTTFKKYMNNGEYANPSEETFAMVFNTTGFTITDSVSAL